MLFYHSLIKCHYALFFMHFFHWKLCKKVLTEQIWDYLSLQRPASKVGSLPILGIDPMETDIIRHKEIKMSAVLLRTLIGGHDFRSIARCVSWFFTLEMNFPTQSLAQLNNHRLPLQGALHSTGQKRQHPSAWQTGSKAKPVGIQPCFFKTHHLEKSFLFFGTGEWCKEQSEVMLYSDWNPSKRTDFSWNKAQYCV